MLTSADGHACMSKPHTPADLLRGLAPSHSSNWYGRIAFPKRFQTLPSSIPLPATRVANEHP